MDNKISTTALTLRLWFISNVILVVTVFVYLWSSGVIIKEIPAYAMALPVSCAATVPVAIGIAITLFILRKFSFSLQKHISLLALSCFVMTIPYCLLAFFGVGSSDGRLLTLAIIASATITFILSLTQITSYFTKENTIDHLPKTDLTMDTHETSQAVDTPSLNTTNHSNKILLKAVITGILIMAMFIPTIFVSNLVTERQTRQQEVVKEVSAKWANAQTITGPYILIPYTDGAATKYFTILPDQLNVNGNITPEERPRSIYKVLLYRTQLNAAGSFLIQAPVDVNPASIRWNEASVCMGLSDLKGIEEKIAINCNQANLELVPGLPSDKLDSIGLSAALNLSITDVGKQLSFAVPFKLRGSEQLHFVPLGGNSSFTLQSSWRNPSFDGNNLPNERTVSDTGFTAKWTFNKANLPFKTVMKDLSVNKESYAFGLSMVQPADQYAKTSRSVKYSLMFIGLTFALFFIIELLQKKPFHPVQYVLVGIALVVFYTLLLSISEFILFNYAYVIAAAATVLLITFYAKGHFGKWSTAALFALVLSILYGFIYVLISLEDTALLVGSIGLFIVLALIMFASRKINWYSPAIANSVDKELSI
ncbi:MAG: cell envelope integrity protein CreD [Filimonas sp.]|nr:cell envelope integrity protein CreD [Filimonas sp.]